MIIEASSLEEAYKIASEKFNCLITELDIEVIQYPSKGFLGLFSKNAIIEVKKTSLSIDEVIDELKVKLNRMFEVSCFDVEVKNVYKIDDETISVVIDGKDAALLIGKDGYRFNALNTLLYNLVYQKYGFKLKLEVAEFIKNQTEAVKNFLAPLIEQIKERGFGKTKPLDGVLVYIALELLRKEFPDYYVAVKEKNGEKFVVVGKRDGYNSSNSNS